MGRDQVDGRGWKEGGHGQDGRVRSVVAIWSESERVGVYKAIGLNLNGNFVVRPEPTGAFGRHRFSSRAHASRLRSFPSTPAPSSVERSGHNSWKYRDGSARPTEPIRSAIGFFIISWQSSVGFFSTSARKCASDAVNRLQVSEQVRTWPFSPFASANWFSPRLNVATATCLALSVYL